MLMLHHPFKTCDQAGVRASAGATSLFEQVLCREIHQHTGHPPMMVSAWNMHRQSQRAEGPTLLRGSIGTIQDTAQGDQKVGKEVGILQHAIDVSSHTL